MPAHSALPFTRTTDLSISSIESRLAALESAARFAHEEKMRALQDQARQSARATGFLEGIMTTMVVFTVAASIIFAVIRS